jgi:hypothetical protein
MGSGRERLERGFVVSTVTAGLLAVKPTKLDL